MIQNTVGDDILNPTDKQHKQPPKFRANHPVFHPVCGNVYNGNIMGYGRE